MFQRSLHRELDAKLRGKLLVSKLNLHIFGPSEVEQETDNDTERYRLLLGYRALQGLFFAGLVAG